MIKIEVARHLGDFLKVPWKIYKNDTYWVPPLLTEQKKLLNEKKNPLFKNAQKELFIAYQDGKMVGRIAAILNKRHNEFSNEKTVFFGFFECINDPNVASELFKSVSSWGRLLGMNKLLGPTSPTMNDEAGLLIEGFDSSPYIMMSYNPSYYPTLLEGHGLKKSKDLFAYYLDIQADPTGLEALSNIAGYVRESMNIVVRNIDLKKNFEKEVRLASKIYNDAWKENWDFTPLSEEEIYFMLQGLRGVAMPEFTFVVEVDGEPAGFCLALPNVNEVLKNINGRLLPFGWWKLLHGMKKISSLRVFALGVLQKYHHSGLGAVCYDELVKRGHQKNMLKGELSWVLEDNEKLNKSLRHLGVKLYKKYRIYEKNIS
ncbi:MAG: GNAT family N-acetyltransferase [Deltaproteobacteria bacterium]|nr:GNAT family N-acetyltransferase [Deltaproteobacteria bacterium]